MLEIEATTHRQIWMGCSAGQFVEKRRRQALALTFDREQMVSTLFQGRGVVANDHVFAPFMPFFDDSVPQRTRDIDAARALLADAGFPDGLQAVLHAVDLQEVPELAQLIQAGAAQAGIELEIAVESGDTLLRDPVVPAGWRPAVRRRRRAGHRRLRPPTGAGRVPQRGVLDRRRVELVAVLQPRLRRRVRRVPARRSESKPRWRPPAKTARRS